MTVSGNLGVVNLRAIRHDEGVEAFTTFLKCAAAADPKEVKVRSHLRRRRRAQGGQGMSARRTYVLCNLAYMLNRSEIGGCRDYSCEKIDTLLMFIFLCYQNFLILQRTVLFHFQTQLFFFVSTVTASTVSTCRLFHLLHLLIHKPSTTTMLIGFVSSL